MRTPFLLLLCFTSTLLLSRSANVAAVPCNPLELFPCAGAFFGSGEPGVLCCAKLREQQPCFCQYMSDPNLKGYVSSPNAKKVADSCGVAFPTC